MAASVRPATAHVENRARAAVTRALVGSSDAATIFANTSDIGTSRELTYVDILRQHVPALCQVALGGFLFDLDGNESHQIDIIITNDQCLRFDFHNPEGSGKSFACVDGCIAVASAKSNLTGPELRNALENLATIPTKSPLRGRHNPMIEVNDYDDWPYKIVFAPRGVAAETAMKGLEAFYAEHPEIPVWKRPNIIHVVGSYAIIRAGSRGLTSRTGERFPSGTFCPSADPDGRFGLPWTLVQMQIVADQARHLLYRYDCIVDRIPKP